MTKSPFIALPVLVLAMIGLTACGDRVVVSELQVERLGWDTLTVSADFSQRRLFGGYEPVAPPSITVRLFDSRFDTLHSGSSTKLIVPDRDLGSEEKVLVELCADFDSGELCEQSGFTASRKKYSVQQEIDYPADNGYDKGEYRAIFKLDRLRFGTEEWEQIELPDSFTRYVIASIDSAEGGAIRIPLRRLNGRFNLSTYDNYRDFRYYLLSHLLDYNAATIRFDMYAANRGQHSILASETRVVKTKSRQTRELEAGMFMQEASRRILSGLRTFPIGTEEFAYLNGWNYIKVTSRYSIEMDLSWRSRFIRERWYTLQGTLEVNEDGTDPTFRVVSGNSRALRRWRDRFRDDTVRMNPLGVKSTEGASETDSTNGSSGPDND
ncbi:MAG: hypothetical protein HKN43_03800 [Rhodothermales bacterium]|nr:hypothetical protein [Rhodothermales bacterium]